MDILTVGDSKCQVRLAVMWEQDPGFPQSLSKDYENLGKHMCKDESSIK